ncbi:hypothetical protein G7046_g600 [Stylonectria norvegica]|nr:hypothetical protein G7046_g600 [Stylonectria norvegica]
MALFGLTISYLVFSVLHLFLFALALATCGLYGTDLHKAHEHDKYADSKWIYAVVVGSISAVTCVVYFIPPILRVGGFFVAIWDFILFILWIALFGVFGKLFIHENPEGDGGIKRMKNAVWVDLTSALLWLIVAVGVLGYWFKNRDTRSRFTGRAHV